MAWADVLAAIGGGAEGAAKGYAWRKDYEQRDRKIQEDAEIRRLNLEIREMLATMQERGRNERYNTPSANVQAQQAGATGRTELTTETQRDIAGARDVTANRAIDVNRELGLQRDSTTRRGQDFGFTLGGMRDDTTRRGQDFGFTLGTNRNTTTQRGQDFTDARARDANRLREQENEKNRQLEREKMQQKGSVFESLAPKIPDATRELRDGTGRPTAEPIEVMEPPSRDTPLPRSPEASGDQMQRLETQARSLMEQYRKEADPGRKAALRSQLQRVRDQIVAAQRKGGGG